MLRVARRIIALLGVLAVMISLFGSPPVKASPRPKTLVLHQSHEMDHLFNNDNDYFSKRFRDERASVTGILTLTFTEPILDLAGSDTAVEFHMVLPNEEKVHATIEGRMDKYETPTGDALVGEFFGEELNHKVLDFSVTYDLESGDAWVVASFGSIQDDDLTIVPFGTRHGRVDEVIRVMKEQSQKARTNVPPTEDREMTIQEVTVQQDDNREGRAGVYHYAFCGSNSYRTGAQYAYVPLVPYQYGLNQEGGGRVFSNTSAFGQWAKCKDLSVDPNNVTLSQAESILTYPTSFYGSGAFPATGQTSYDLTVPVYVPTLGWQILGLSYVVEKVTATYSQANGSSRPNRLTHVWEDHNIPFFDPAKYNYDPSVDLYEQGERGWAGQGLWAYQLTTSGSDVVYHRGRVHYSTYTFLGKLPLTSEAEVGFRVDYQP